MPVVFIRTVVAALIVAATTVPSAQAVSYFVSHDDSSLGANLRQYTPTGSQIGGTFGAGRFVQDLAFDPISEEVIAATRTGSISTLIFDRYSPTAAFNGGITTTVGIGINRGTDLTIAPLPTTARYYLNEMDDTSSSQLRRFTTGGATASPSTLVPPGNRYPQDIVFNANTGELVALTRTFGSANALLDRFDGGLTHNPPALNPATSINIDRGSDIAYSPLADRYLVNRDDLFASNQLQLISASGSAIGPAFSAPTGYQVQDVVFDPTTGGFIAMARHGSGQLRFLRYTSTGALLSDDGASTSIVANAGGDLAIAYEPALAQTDDGGLQADGYTVNKSFGSVIVGGTANDTSLSVRNTGEAIAQMSYHEAGDVSMTGGGPLLGGGAADGLTVTLDTSTVGAKTGDVRVVDGANPLDLDESYDFTGTVLDHANASFSSSTDLDVLSLDLGTHTAGGPTVSQTEAITNLLTTAGFTADLDLLSLSGTGDTGVLTTDLAPFAGLGESADSFFDVFFDISTPGTYSASYTLNLSDDQTLSGAVGQTLTLNLSGVVNAALTGVPEPGTSLLVGLGLLGFVLRRRRQR